MSQTRRLWWGLGVLLVASFSVLLYMGSEIHRAAPPMPEAVVSESGDTVFTREDIEVGRTVWQSFGGQQLGSIWGHGALVAPDWSADWLHREAVAWLDLRAQQAHGVAYAELSAGNKAKLEAELRPDIRRNRYDDGAKTVTVSDERAQAIANVQAHYVSLFGDHSDTAELRETYAMKDNTVDTPEHRRQLAAFFFWTSWAAVTERTPGEASYTNNWPYEPLVGNAPTSSNFMWTVFSVLFLIAGIGLLG